MKTSGISLSGAHKTSLYNEIHSLKNQSSLSIRRMYGDFGVDIFEGKTNLSILSDKERKPSIFNRIKFWFTGDYPLDYEAGDSLFTVVFKYIGNKKVGLEKDIEEKFGQKGLKKLESMRQMGYVEV